MSACWSCHEQAGEGVFCEACGKIQPARPKDAFALLGLGAPRFHVDEKEVDKAWREQSRKVHPDRFAKADARERRFALEQTSALNEARKTLRDPVRRAGYLFRREGLSVPGEKAGTPGAGEVLPLEFYEQVMEDREALVEAKTQGPEAVQRLVERIEKQKAEVLRSIDSAFTSWEKGAGRGALEPAVVELAKVRYFDRFMDEVAGRPHD